MSLLRPFALPAAPRSIPLRRRKRSLMRRVMAISSLVGVVICGLVAAIMLFNARIAIVEETDAAFEAARLSVQLRLPPRFGGGDSLVNAAALSAEMDAQRHISARLLDPKGEVIGTATADPERDSLEVPQWFATLMQPELRTEIFVISSYPNILGTLELSTDPWDEISEVWNDFRIIMPLLLMTGLGMVGMTFLLGKIVLRHLGELRQALAAMKAGDVACRAPDDPLREFAELAEGINDLAAFLAAEREENAKLQERLLTVAEAEREKIASDLHDEMGPQLFALNATLMQAEAALARMEGAAAGTETGEVQEALAASMRYAHAVQQSARSAINDLRPMLVGHGSLSEVLGELVADCRALAPEVQITLQSEGELRCSELGELTIYRFLRESIFNAIRHGKPRRVVITLQAEGAPQPRICVRVSDDGRGPSPLPLALGRGIIGMRDRARALGAQYAPPRREGKLTITELRMPC